MRSATTSVLIVVLALGLAGCTEKSGGSLGPASGADDLQTIRARGVLKVGVKADAPPFGWKDEFGFYGFDVDIANALAGELGIDTVEFVTVTSADRLDKVASGEIDMAIASMTITRGREEKVDFTIPYFQDGQGIMVRSGSTIADYEDLGGKTVGGVKGATSVANIRQVQPECAVSEFGGYQEALKALRSERVDAVTSDMLILLGLRLGSPNPDEFMIVGTRFSTEPYGIAVRENQSEWRDALNGAIQALWEDGRWQRIYENWFGANARYSTDVPFVIVPFPR
jgi:polar amino acid transport system substrate-binding protein